MDKASTITTLTARRSKWQYPPPPPTPRILHLPRRPRRKQPAKPSAAKSCSKRDRKDKLETLFDQERVFTREVMPVLMVSGGGDDQCEEERRERVEERESVVMEEEKWKFQAEMLRAECNLLRMERDIAVKKMERRRVQVERALRSAVQTLLSGREKMCSGQNANMVLEEEIIELADKLEKLQRRSRNREVDVQKCCNFDKQASLLQRRLQKFAGESDEISVKEIQEMAEASLSSNTASGNKENFVSNSSSNMEALRRKVQGLSRGSLLESMEVEYRTMLSTANSSASGSSYAATSKRIELSEISSSSMRQTYKERACSGCCKAIVQRVVEQVRAETEQWSQMQEMLGQVRDEMEELQASRDFWEDRALDSDHQIQLLRSAVKEWRQRALSSDAKANELQAQVSTLQAELEKLRKEKTRETNRNKNPAANSHESPNEMEKRVLVCRLKENRQANDDCCKQQESLDNGRKKTHTRGSGLNALKRSPFIEIGNSSSLATQNSKGVLPLHCPLPSNVQRDS